jgi:hypothetical protein
LAPQLDEEQHTPSTQLPDAHSVPVRHAEPMTLRQVPAASAQVRPAPHELVAQHVELTQ